MQKADFFDIVAFMQHGEGKPSLPREHKPSLPYFFWNRCLGFGRTAVIFICFLTTIS
ncbi:MAG: hypothetical protein AB7D38_05025 [Sulfurimonas sp.]